MEEEDSMGNTLICLVTIHGIGFQQPPLSGVAGYPDTPGYADSLHEHLSKYLDQDWLCDDPRRQRDRPGQNGPIYVQSVWPPASHCREAGLRRLGSWDVRGPNKGLKWDENCRAIIAGPEAQFRNGAGRIAHIALVYSQLEEQGPQIESSLITSSLATVSLGHYTHVAHLVRTTFLDTEPLWRNLLSPTITTSKSTSLRKRLDPGFKQRQAIPQHIQQPDGLMTILRQLENDVAAYVCHNEMRERVRDFVSEALLRLACRNDVAGIVINAHSNGTVIALDILHHLPPFAARKIRTLITAGSPLRKYTDFFNWGQYLTMVPRLAHWLNFLDPKDPVADPLVPDAHWVGGTSLQPDIMTGLYKGLDPDTGAIYRIPIQDIMVDNLKYSLAGGLQAHNYWDNEVEFVAMLADVLQGEVCRSESNI
jgi:hypothetical protein